MHEERRGKQNRAKVLFRRERVTGRGGEGGGGGRRRIGWRGAGVSLRCVKKKKEKNPAKEGRDRSSNARAFPKPVGPKERAMIAPRVVRTADNETGRCTEWPAKHSSYTALYDQPPRATLPSCRFARAAPVLQQQPPPINHYPSSPPYGHQASGGTPLPYHAPLPCTEPPSTTVDQSQCGQFQNAGWRNCQLGPIDVEDLALYFEDRSQINRASRPSINSSNFRRPPRSINNPSYPSTSDGQLSEFPSNVARTCADDWPDGQFCDTCTQQQFPFCTEERWLQCPASDRCPLYDDNVYPYGGNPVLPPCVYEDLGNGYCRYSGYNGDDQILEDYL